MAKVYARQYHIIGMDGEEAVRTNRWTCQLYMDDNPGKVARVEIYEQRMWYDEPVLVMTTTPETFARDVYGELEEVV